MEEENPFGLYEMKRGESLEEVCLRRGVPPLCVIRFNKLDRPPEAGEILSVPRGKVHIVSAGETSASVSAAFGMSEDEFCALNGKDLFVGQEVLVKERQDA